MDLDLIVRNIYLGEGAMPAFPHLDALDIASLATFIRNSWGNEFGGAQEDEVAQILDDIAEAVEQQSVWDGVYTEEQAQRGQQLYVCHCAQCHGLRGDGAGEAEMPASPAVAGTSFLREWDGRNVATLYEFTRSTMPQINPGGLADREYADILAYTFQLSGLPAGDKELEPDAAYLSTVVLEPQPARD